MPQHLHTAMLDMCCGCSACACVRVLQAISGMHGLDTSPFSMAMDGSASQVQPLSVAPVRRGAVLYVTSRDGKAQDFADAVSNCR